MELTRNKVRVFNFLQGAGKALGCFYIHPDIDTIMKAQREGETWLQIKILEDIWNPIDGIDYHKGEIHEINPQNFEQHRREGPLSRLYSPLAMECWSYLIVEQFIYSLRGLIWKFDKKPYEEDQGFKRWVHPWENYELFENRLGRLWQSQGYLRDHCGVNVLNTWNGVRERHSFFLESGLIYNLAAAFVKNFYSLKSSDDYTFLGNRLVRNLNHFAAYSTMLNPNCTMDDFRSFKQIFMWACKLGWLEIFKVPQGYSRWDSEGKAEPLTGEVILQDNLPELISGFWEFFMEFSQEKGGLFDWEGSEEEPLVMQNSGARGFCHDRDRRLEHKLGHLLGKYNDDNQESALSIMMDYLAFRAKGLATERVIYVRWDKLEDNWHGTFNPDYAMQSNLPETYQLPFYFNAWITRKLP